MPLAPGSVRDAIVAYLSAVSSDASVAEICLEVGKSFGDPVPASSVRSYLNGNVPGVFTRTARGRYRLTKSGAGGKRHG